MAKAKAKAKAKTKASKKKTSSKKVVKKKVSKKVTTKKTANKKVSKTKASKAKKTTAKKAPSKKSASKKSGTKKSATKKPAAKKAQAKKAVAKKRTPTKKKTSTPKVSKKKSVEKKPSVAKKKTAQAAKKPKTKREKATVGQARPAALTSQSRPKPLRKIVNLDDVKIPTGYKPSDKEQYMGPKHLLYFKLKLQNWRDELILESQETLEHLRTETRDVGDEAERASRESDNILELRTRDRYRKLLRKIEEALKRVDEGDYGYCEETGEEIGLGRLEARPIATLTVDAQERREMFQKQFRDDR